MKPIIYIICGGAAFFGSFFITLWLTEPQDTFAPRIASEGSDTQRLATERISSYSDLPSAARDVGLHFSREITGALDTITRINEREVNIGGWLADLQGNSTPLNVLVFNRGSMVAATQTKGERRDVANAYNLGHGAEQMKNVAFSLNFNCRLGEQPVVVGVGQGQQYTPLEPSKSCP